MKKKYILIIIILFCLVSLMGLGIFKVASNIKKDKDNTQKQSETIKVSYEEFNELANRFNEKNKEYQEKMANVYYETLEKEENNLHQQLDTLSNVFESMQTAYDQIKEICKVKYEDSNANQFCESMIVSLESAAKIVENGVEEYNTLIKKYNVWQEENTKYNQLEIYKPKLSEE